MERDRAREMIVSVQKIREIPDCCNIARVISINVLCTRSHGF